MRLSSSSVLILSACAFKSANAQGFGNNPTFAGSAQPVGVATPPPVVTPSPTTEAPTTEAPTITPEPTDMPTPTPSVSNEDVCEDLDEVRQISVPMDNVDDIFSLTLSQIFRHNDLTIYRTGKTGTKRALTVPTTHANARTK